jgi:hypothetical protein
MNCKNARERITDALANGQMKLAGEVAVHLLACEGCRAYHAQQAELFRAMDSGLRAMANEPVPPSLLTGVRVRLEETRTSSHWLYRLLPVSAVLVVAALIAVPLLRRSIRSGGVQVIAIPKHMEKSVEPPQAIAEQPDKSNGPRAPQEQIVHTPSRALIARRPMRPIEVAVIVDPGESKGLFELAAAANQSPQIAQAMLHPVAPPPIEMEPIKTVELANLEVKPLSEENQ